MAHSGALEPLPFPPSVRLSRPAQSWPRLVELLSAATSGIVGGLIGLGLPEIEAKRYEKKLKEENYLISVQTHDGDREDMAKEIRRFGSKQVALGNR